MMNRLIFDAACRLAYGKTMMDGGSTVTTKDAFWYEIPTEGYVVGGLWEEVKLPKEICTPNLFRSVWMRYMEQAQVLCKGKDKDDTISIGTWVDCYGAVVFDIAEIFTDSEHDDGTLASVRAMDRCIQRDEDAMFDLANHKDIPNPTKTKTT
jgi:hypothetical protein